MSAEVMRRAARAMRRDAAPGGWVVEVASWLNHQATRAEKAEEFGDYDERHWQAPLVIARAYLGERHTP